MTSRRTKLSDWKVQRLLELFIAEVTARRAAELVGVSKDTAALFYRKVRGVIARRLKHETPFAGEVGVDESYFGGARKGRRGRGAAGKVAVFGILKRVGKVYTVVPDDLKAKTLMPINREKVVPDSIVYIDGFKGYDVLDVGEFKHERINHGEGLVDDAGKHINGIENFRNQAKRILRKYNGIPRDNFELFIKECGFRFNYGSPKEQLQLLKRWLREEGVI